VNDPDPRTGRLILLHTEEHRQLIHDFRSHAEAWLHSRGVDQFQPDSPTQASLAHHIINRLFDRGHFVGLKLNGRIVAVGALTDPDPDFWTPEEIAQPQVYVGRFLVAEHGKGYGEQLLARVAADAAQQGIPVMRLDCWRTSTGLHDYYRRLGFRHLRTVPVLGRGSGTLFELDLARPNPLTDLLKRDLTLPTP
jgi:hypothetical protein